ncbi:MAG: hypothetical protein WDW36_001405 [Sanguina aurantia]
MTAPKRGTATPELEPAVKAEPEAKEPEVIYGLRDMKAEVAAKAAQVAGVPARAPVAAPVPVSSVGDGGASWRLKALRRAREQASADGTDLNSVVSERWGSLTSLTSSLTSVRAADAHAHLTAGSHRAREERFRQQRQQAGDAAAGAAVGGAPTSEAGDGRDRTARPRPAEEPGSRAAAHTARDPGREAGSSRPAQGDRSRDGSGTAAAAAATAGTSSGGGGGGGDGGGGSSGRQTTRDRQQLSKDAPAGGGGASYLRDVGSDKTRMQRPSGDDSLSWRRADERGRGGGGDRGRGDRERGAGQASGGAGGREEEEAKGVKAGDASSSQGGRGGRSEQSDGQRHGRDGEERGAGEAQRGGSSHHHHRSDQRGSEDAGRCPPRHHNSSSRDNTSHSSNPRRRGNAQQMDLLQGIASSLNTFADDGSFLKQFAASNPTESQADATHDDASAQPSNANSQSQPATRQSEPHQQPRHSERGERTGEDRDGDRGPGGMDGVEAVEAPPRPQPAVAANRSIAALLRERMAAGGSTADVAAAAAAAAAVATQVAIAAAAAAAAAAAEAGEDLGVGVGGGGGSSSVGSGGGGNRSAMEMIRARLQHRPGVGATQDNGGAAGPAAASGGGAGAGAGAGGEGAPATRKKELVNIPLVDGRGKLAPGAFGRDVAGAGALEGGGKRAGSKVQRYNAEGEKERYFHDDDKSDLATLVKRAKYGDDGTDMDAAVAGNIMSRKKFKATDLDVDAEYDYDGGLEMYESKARKGGAEVQRQRDRSRQISDHSRILKAEDACTYCVASARRPRHLTISLGQSTYLMVPPRGRLVPGHVVITPAEHATSLRQVDDGVWEEVKNFQKCLIRMFAGQGQSVLFMETALDVQGHRRHATMDAIPMSDAVLEKAKGYFKKGLQEAESEWSTHAARAVIDTTNKKGLRESVPPNFPYFYVQFGYSCGYLHVVDDEKKFDANFGRQVLSGILKLGAEVAHQKAKAESMTTQQQWVTDFRRTFKAHDWTAQLA